MEIFVQIYEYVIFFYSLTLILLYSALITLSYFRISKYLSQKNKELEKIVAESPFIPGISSSIGPAIKGEILES